VENLDEVFLNPKQNTVNLIMKTHEPNDL